MSARAQPSNREVRLELGARLRSRRAEIEQAATTRVFTISGSREDNDPVYAEGLRAAVTAAFDFGFASIETGEDSSEPLPPALLVQARLAVRNHIPLDTVLRRYFAGYALLGDYVLEEAKDADLLEDPALRCLLQTNAATFDRLVVAVTEEYERELARRPAATAEQRRVERIERLLAGELLDTSDIDYDFGSHHLGVIGVGEEAEQAIRGLSNSLDRRLLLVRPAGEETWAWLGGRRRDDPVQLKRHLSQTGSAQVSLVLGEPAQGLAGWRLTHQQAKAALPIALRRPQRLIRYADVALLASILQDELFTTSLRELYLSPLSEERDGGVTLRETLRAYFAAERNVTSATAALGVSERTVASRLHTIEERLGHPLSACAAEAEAALRLQDLDKAPIRQGDVSRNI